MILAAVAGFGLASCKKDYTCKCTLDGESQNYEYSNVKKADAEDACDTQQKQFSSAGINAACSI